MPERGTSEGRYLFEFDGVSAVRSSEVSGVSKEHSPFELAESNRPNPHLGRGNYKCSEITVRHAHALNETGFEVFQWMQDFITGANVERRSGRLIVLDEDGQTPVQTYELRECVPTKFEADTHTAGGSNPSYFRFSLRPTDFELI